MSENNNLLPCKLCNGKAQIFKTEIMDGYCHYNNWIVRCVNCGCTFEFAADGYYGRDYFSEYDVIKRWNELHKKNTTTNS